MVCARTHIFLLHLWDELSNSSLVTPSEQIYTGRRAVTVNLISKTAPSHTFYSCERDWLQRRMKPKRKEKNSHIKCMCNGDSSIYTVGSEISPTAVTAGLLEWFSDFRIMHTHTARPRWNWHAVLIGQSAFDVLMFGEVIIAGKLFQCRTLGEDA